MLISLVCFLSAEFGMKEDLRKIEAGGVSSRELYVKREYSSEVTDQLIQIIIWFLPSCAPLCFSPVAVTDLPNSDCD